VHNLSDFNCCVLVVELETVTCMFFFSYRACEEEGKARMGVVECLNHRLVEPYNVLYEKEGKPHLGKGLGD